MYYYNQLEIIKNDIQNYIQKAQKLDSRLLFNLRWNLKEISKAQRQIRDTTVELTQSQSKRFNEFQQKRINLVKDHGGKVTSHEGEIVIENFEELNANPAFREQLDTLVTNYSDIIDTVQQVETANPPQSVNFVEIPILAFPDQLDESFTESFLEFVTNEKLI